MHDTARLAALAFAILAIFLAAGCGDLLGGKKITKAQYDSLREGMTYAEVAKILGSEGTEVTSSAAVPGRLGGGALKIYSWTSPDSASVSVTFQNGKLMSKSHFGLQ